MWFRTVARLQRSSTGVGAFAGRRQFSAPAVHAKGAHPKQDWGNFHPPKVSREHKVVSEIFMFYVYFWFFYRFRQDGGSLLNMWHPWDGHHEDHGAHGDEHEHH